MIIQSDLQKKIRSLCRQPMPRLGGQNPSARSTISLLLHMATVGEARLQFEDGDKPTWIAADDKSRTARPTLVSEIILKDLDPLTSGVLLPSLFFLITKLFDCAEFALTLRYEDLTSGKSGKPRMLVTRERDEPDVALLYLVGVGAAGLFEVDGHLIWAGTPGLYKGELQQKFADHPRYAEWLSNQFNQPRVNSAVKQKIIQLRSNSSRNQHLVGDADALWTLEMEGGAKAEYDEENLSWGEWPDDEAK